MLDYFTNVIFPLCTVVMALVATPFLFWGLVSLSKVYHTPQVVVYGTHLKQKIYFMVSILRQTNLEYSNNCVHSYPIAALKTPVFLEIAIGRCIDPGNSKFAPLKVIVWATIYHNMLDTTHPCTSTRKQISMNGVGINKFVG